MAELAPGNTYEVQEKAPGVSIIIYDSLDSGDTEVVTAFEHGGGTTHQGVAVDGPRPV